MDNCATCCNGYYYGAGGYCDNDLILRFEDRLGNGCQSRWLTNFMRWKRGNTRKNKDDAFDGEGWEGFVWTDALCAKDDGFYVPNKVKKKIHKNGMSSVYNIFG